MALREFTDSGGRAWRVWDVFPTLTERRHRNAGPPPGIRERRRFVEARAPISPSMAQGWLVFEAANGERRRLAPIPSEEKAWHAMSDDALRSWCALAKPAPPVRRLIE
jgi:hypothetical protein